MHHHWRHLICRCRGTVSAFRDSDLINAVQGWGIVPQWGPTAFWLKWSSTWTFRRRFFREELSSYFSHIFPLSLNTKKKKKVFLLLLFSPQFCFSSAIIPAREIKNHDTYNEHKYYFNLQAPVIASSWATSSGKYQGEVRTWIVQKRWGDLMWSQQSVDSLPSPNSPDPSLRLSAEDRLHCWSPVVSPPCSDPLCQRLWGEWQEEFSPLQTNTSDVCFWWLWFTRPTNHLLMH